MENIILINGVEDFLKLREKENSKGIIYKLMSDLDLENVDLSLTNLNFSGEFDGNNHTIRNAKYSPAKGRTGLLFKSIEDATIKNLRFFNCTVSSNVDSIALISGILVKGYANFTNIEISYSKVETNQNYAAFLFSRNDSDKANIYLNNIVVKNLSKVKCQTYGGVLLGDVLYGSSIVIKNTKVISDFYTTSSGGFLTGRARGANIDISNTYVSGTLFGGANRTGILVGGTGGAKANNISFNNVLAKDFILKTYKGISLTGDLFTGSLDAINFLSNNVYYQNIIGYDFKSLTTKSYEIKNEIIHLGNEFDNSYNLKFESKNNYDSKFIDLIVLHDDVKKTYFKEDLDKIDLTNLVVAKRYQNESIEFVDKYDIEIVDLKDTSISLSNFKDLSIGTYNIKISSLFKLSLETTIEPWVDGDTFNWTSGY